jgi:hypothetical protein
VINIHIMNTMTMMITIILHMRMQGTITLAMTIQAVHTAMHHP